MAMTPRFRIYHIFSQKAATKRWFITRLQTIFRAILARTDIKLTGKLMVAKITLELLTSPRGEQPRCLYHTVSFTILYIYIEGWAERGWAERGVERERHFCTISDSEIWLKSL